MPKFRNGLSREGEVYHYCFRINGQQYKGSTRARDRASAEKVLQEKRKEALFGPPEPKASVPFLKDLTANWLETHRPTHSLQHLKSVEHLTRNDVQLEVLATLIRKFPKQASALTKEE